jgi:hypothetical protein
MACGCKRRPSTEDDPIVFGEPVGPVIQARATVTLTRATPGEVVWVQGSQVGAMIDGGWLVPVT